MKYFLRKCVLSLILLSTMLFSIDCGVEKDSEETEEAKAGEDTSEVTVEKLTNSSPKDAATMLRELTTEKAAEHLAQMTQEVAANIIHYMAGAPVRLKGSLAGLEILSKMDTQIAVAAITTLEKYYL